MGEFLLFHDDAPLVFISPLLYVYIWNRVFDNSLFSSALSGKSSCQQFRRSSIQRQRAHTRLNIYKAKASPLFLSLSLFIYLIINGDCAAAMPPLSWNTTLFALLFCWRRRRSSREKKNLFDPRWMDIITTRLETFKSARSFNSCTLRRSLICTVNSFAIMRISDRDVNFIWKREEGKRITGNGPRPSFKLSRKEVK